MTDPQQTPAQALEAIRQSRNLVREAVRDGKRGFRYALKYSGILAVMVGGQALPMPLNVLCSTLGALALALLARAWSRRTGVWISGVSPRRARWVALGMGVVLVGLMFVALWAGHEGHRWFGVPLGALAFGAGMVGSWLWTKVFLAETSDQ